MTASERTPSRPVQTLGEELVSSGLLLGLVVLVGLAVLGLVSLAGALGGP